MKFFSRLFSKSPADLLAKGDRFLESERFFEARNCYEDGLQICASDKAHLALESELRERILNANYKLAELNMSEAEFSISRGDMGKAIDHIELVKTLTYDVSIREKAELLLKSCTENVSHTVEKVSSTGCASCSSGHSVISDAPHNESETLHPLEYFDLLARQLPDELYQRYSELGEDFAYAYVAACQDNHLEALSLLDKLSVDSYRDIYFCERGKILHRLGNVTDAELHLRKAVEINQQNSLAWLNLSLLFIEGGRLQEAMVLLEAMIERNYFKEQSMILRGEILESTGDLDGAVEQYSTLLGTGLARTAAEKLYLLLGKTGREADAAIVFKKYLGKCSH